MFIKDGEILKIFNKDKVELIKPNSKKDTYKKFISPILLAIIGLIFLTNSNEVIIYGCYVIGAIIAGFGIFNIIKYYQMKQQLKIEDSKKLTTGIIFITTGVLIIILASIIQTFLNLIIGIWLIIIGIGKLIGIQDLYITDRKTANLNIIQAFIVIIMGLYCIFFQNIILALIGAWMLVSAGIDLYNKLKK